MAHFKLDPSYLIERADSILNTRIEVGPQLPGRQEIMRGFFLSEVLQVMVHHVDQKHWTLHQLIKEYPWLDFVKTSNGSGGNLRTLHVESVYHGNEKEKLENTARSLNRAPLRLTLVLADVVRLFRCFLITEYLKTARPEFYILGKSLINYLPEHGGIRRGVSDVYIRDLLTKIGLDEKGVEDPPLQDTQAWHKRLFPNIWSAEVARRDFDKFNDTISIIERKLDNLIKQDSEAQKMSTRYKSAYWNSVLKHAPIDHPESLGLKVWDEYNYGFRVLTEWNIFKNQIRTICLSMGSPQPHDDPLDNISELRRHLSHHNYLYETIQTLNDKIEIQQRIITNLSFRHLLENLAPKRTNENQKEADRWGGFWKKACAQAEADRANPPSPNETNAEHQAKRNAKRNAGRENAVKATSKSLDGKSKEKKANHGSEASVPSKIDLESQCHRTTPSENALTLSSEKSFDLKAEPGAGFASEAGSNIPGVKDSQISKISTVSSSKQRLTQETEQSETIAESSNSVKKLPNNAFPNIDIMSKPYEVSPLVDVIKKCQPGDMRSIGGASLYHLLSENIHGFEQDEDAYIVKRSQWNNVEFQILTALKPKLGDNGRVDWEKERARYVSDF